MNDKKDHCWTSCKRGFYVQDDCILEVFEPIGGCDFELNYSCGVNHSMRARSFVVYNGEVKVSKTTVRDSEIHGMSCDSLAEAVEYVIDGVRSTIEREQKMLVVWEEFSANPGDSRSFWVVRENENVIYKLCRSTQDLAKGDLLSETLMNINTSFSDVEVDFLETVYKEPSSHSLNVFLDGNIEEFSSEEEARKYLVNRVADNVKELKCVGKLV